MGIVFACEPDSYKLHSKAVLPKEDSMGRQGTLVSAGMAVDMAACKVLVGTLAHTSARKLWR
jgi:hypothetical protein